LEGWELISIGEDGIDIKVDFTDPINVSGDDEPDLLLV